MRLIGDVEAFEDLYFKTCTMDYSKMSKSMEILKQVMETSDEVMIKAPGTDAKFSISGIPAVTCNGHGRSSRWRGLYRTHKVLFRRDDFIQCANYPYGPGTAGFPESCPQR